MQPVPKDVIRTASTLMVLRDSPTGPEVLMLRRAERGGDRMSGACVFPGGAIDVADRSLHAFASGLDDAAASRALAVPNDGLDFHVAAIRECFEESGLLYAVDADDPRAWVTPDADTLASLRGAAREGGHAFESLLAERRWRLAVDRLAYCGHWLTPAGLPKRFDTRFFVAIAPVGQVALHDGIETVGHVWLRPADALEAGSGLKLMQITRHMLRWAARFESADACIAAARALPEVRLQVPRIGAGRAGPRTVLPGEPAYAEIGRLDPDGTRHDARHEIEPGVPVRLSPAVIRVTAPNPGVMTGPGTNSYLVGGGASNEWAVIDPGPDDAVHCAALIAAAPGPIRAILVTHTHLDHSPGAARLREATSAPVYGRSPSFPAHQDASFRADHAPVDGDRIRIGDTSLRVIHTPGHASNHLCFLLEGEQVLFTGDHVIQGSTVVINPPDGDMAVYLASLTALLHEDIAWLAPGHGFLIDDPRGAFSGLIRHRLAREAKVLAALRQSPSPTARSTLDELLQRVYDDTPSHLHAVARRSLLAHLSKLASGGEVDENEAGWAPVRRESSRGSTDRDI